MGAGGSFWKCSTGLTVRTRWGEFIPLVLFLFSRASRPTVVQE